MLIVGQLRDNVEIIDYSHEGLGVAKIDNFVTFIPYSIKNKRYLIKITEVKKQFAYGEIVNNDITTDCPYYLNCGGCQIRHLDYQQQLLFKENIVKNTLKKQHLDVNVNPIVANENIDNYRNKVIMPIKMINGKLVSGYYQNKTHLLTPIANCLLAPSIVSDIINDSIKLLNDIKETAYDEDTKKGNLRNIMVRYSPVTNQVMVCLVTYFNKLKDNKYFVKELTKKYKNITSIVINQHQRANNATLGFKNFNLYNCNFIEDQLGDIKYRIEPNTFFQVNTLQAQKLYDLVLEALSPTDQDTVLDAYCGVGSIGCYIASKVKEVVGVEVNAKSIKLAQINSQNNQLDNTTFICGDMHNPKLNLDFSQFNKVIVDPPRSGLDQQLISLLNNHGFEKLVYVSCNPATLARDLAKLAKSYIIKQLTPVDMFSNTYHVECVVELIKK